MPSPKQSPPANQQQTSQQRPIVPLCLRIIRQTSGTCYFNSALNGFLQSGKTLSIFMQEFVKYVKQLAHNVSVNPSQTSGRMLTKFLDQHAFCPPASLINAIATSDGQLEPRFEAARFQIMKAILTFHKHAEEFETPNQNVPASVAKYVLDTTKKSLSNVRTEGGLPIKAAKAILRSVFGDEYEQRVLFRFESQMADPVEPHTVQIIMMLPGLEGDQWLLDPSRLQEGFDPENICALFNAMLSSHSKALTRASEIGVITSLLVETVTNQPSPNSTLSPIVELYLTNKVLQVVQSMVTIFQDWYKVTRKRKHSTFITQPVHTLDARNANKLFAELKVNLPGVYAQFISIVRADPRFTSASAQLAEYVEAHKTKIEKQIKLLRRNGINNWEPRPLKPEYEQFELSHALFSHKIGPSSHAVAGILCSGKPYIADSNMPRPYASDWPSGHGRFFQYPKTKDEPEFSTTGNDLMCACYVRKDVPSYDA